MPHTAAWSSTGSVKKKNVEKYTLIQAQNYFFTKPTE
ncbi:hypothetical protein BH11BAC5_BH11BAC5_23750 [soil metagenome]